MSPETIEFLTWLVSRQTITVGDEDAEGMSVRAFRALDELRAAAAPA